MKNKKLIDTFDIDALRRELVGCSDCNDCSNLVITNIERNDEDIDLIVTFKEKVNRELIYKYTHENLKKKEEERLEYVKNRALARKGE